MLVTMTAFGPEGHMRPAAARPAQGSAVRGPTPAEAALIAEIRAVEGEPLDRPPVLVTIVCMTGFAMLAAASVGMLGHLLHAAGLL